ncbi:MAG: proton-conducting transporter membrane subunit [Candidatus Omnitrophica bacterium]|nr:proton-conducting transporter membrane subunit [Candidatus Omnitrophota bacterium]
MLSLFILLPFFCLIAVNLPVKGARRLAFWLTASLFVLQILAVLLHPSVFWGMKEDLFANFFAINFSVNNLSLVIFLTIGIVGLVSLIIGKYTLANRPDRFHFTNLLLTALIGMNALALLTDLFSMYVFIEVTALSSFILIAVQREKTALEGAFKYLIISTIASALMLSSVALILLVSGSTSFDVVSAALKASSGSVFVKLAVALFLCGPFIKSGLVPFHGWLPDAYSAAPSAVSVLLAGIITKVSGVYVLMKLVMSVFGFTPVIRDILMFAGALSIVFGALAAIGQKDFKRMLAYSSISQVGYIIIGLGCGTKLAIAGAALHFFNHAVFKSLLFTNAAVMEQKLGTVDMDKMGGLTSRMPFTGMTSLIAFLSTAGIPPLSGFWSKLLIVVALWTSGMHGYAAIALLASVLTLAYFLSMQRRVFFGKLRPGLEAVQEAGTGLVITQVALALVILGVGLGFPFMLKTLAPLKNILW